MSDSTTPNASDLLAVRSRISWGAIAAGAMVALATYVVLTLLGLAVGIEVAVRGSDVSLGAPAAIYTLVTLLVAMFFGGWATSRLAVGESKLESVLYGIILWGILFVGMVWLVSAGLSIGFGAMLGLASGVYSTTEGGPNADRIATDLARPGPTRRRSTRSGIITAASGKTRPRWPATPSPDRPSARSRSTPAAPPGGHWPASCSRW